MTEISPQTVARLSNWQRRFKFDIHESHLAKSRFDLVFFLSLRNFFSSFYFFIANFSQYSILLEIPNWFSFVISVMFNI